ncbi:glutathione peroxidase [Konateibacter massiliensis]|uniref:glutathione peroxidase n=1 Tax=Konateibacter massiliensis TaxID=2002841 RepID=UPI000C15B315|nr:glutathione peroxidase [Konateibacter massiliensis]
MNIFDFDVKNAAGETVSMSDYKGKVVLVVNTATGCGFTPQYEGLQKLYDKYKEQGFVVLDFPCNQFANQAPGTEEEIHSFCQLKYNTTFPLFAKVDVNGENEEPLFQYLKSQQKGIMGSKIKWNFTKFLVDKDGKVVERFAPTTAPEKIEESIKKLI